MICYPGQRPQIVDAYFVNATDHNVCGVKFKATPAADGDFQCLFDLKQTDSHCMQRLGYSDLCVVYNTCAPLSRNCGFSSISNTKLLSLRSTFRVHYLCIQENSTIDPCLAFEEQRSHASLWLPYSTTSCHSVCEITPVNTERSVYFKYQLIQGFTKSGQVVRDNNITYEITFTPSTGKTPQWEQFHSSYYDDYQLWQHVDKLQIRFNIPRGDVVRHLWISFNDTEVNIACTGHPTNPPDSTTPTTGGPTKNTEMNISCTSISPSASPPIAGTESNTSSGSVNTASSTPDSIKSTPEVQTMLTTESGSEDGDQNPTLIIIIVAAVIAVAVAAGVLFAVIFIVRKRRGRQKRHGNAETKGDNESHPENQTHSSLPSPNDGDYTECFMPDDSNPDAALPRDPEAEPIMTTHSRCDVGDEYVTLQRDARVGMAGRSEESENYDHMPVGTRPRSDVYNVLQREEKKQAVVDNVYNTTYLTS